MCHPMQNPKIPCRTCMHCHHSRTVAPDPLFSSNCFLISGGFRCFEPNWDQAAMRRPNESAAQALALSKSSPLPFDIINYNDG